MSIMVTKGTLDWAYPPFIFASTAAALGWDATLFFYLLRTRAVEERPESEHQSARQSRHAHEDALWATMVPGD